MLCWRTNSSSFFFGFWKRGEAFAGVSMASDLFLVGGGGSCTPGWLGGGGV